MGDFVTELEFVNDWTELEAAVELIKNLFNHTYVDIQDDYDQECWQAVDTISEYVPRLLTQYANLVELSFALTEGWEQYATLQGQSGLDLPDHR